MRAYFFDRFNYWAFIHTRDSTQAFEKALTADFQGAHALFVNSDLNFLNYDAEALLAIFFPEVSRRSKALRGPEALVNIERARQLIGFEPTVHLTVLSNLARWPRAPWRTEVCRGDSVNRPPDLFRRPVICTVRRGRGRVGIADRSTLQALSGRPIRVCPPRQM